VTNELALLAHWSVRQKIKCVNTVQLRRSERALTILCSVLQLYDAFETFGVQQSSRHNKDHVTDDVTNDDDGDDDNYDARSQGLSQRRYRTTGGRPSRPLADMAAGAQPSTGEALWTGWDTGQVTLFGTFQSCEN